MKLGVGFKKLVVASAMTLYGGGCATAQEKCNQSYSVRVWVRDVCGLIAKDECRIRAERSRISIYNVCLMENGITPSGCYIDPKTGHYDCTGEAFGR